MNISSRDSIKTAGLMDFLNNAILKFKKWRAHEQISKSTNQQLESAYNFLKAVIEQADLVVSNMESITEGARSGEAKISREGEGDEQLTPEVANAIIEKAKKTKEMFDDTLTKVEEEISKRNLKINQLPNGKYYFMEQRVAKMKLNRLSSRRLNRFVRLNKAAGAEPLYLLEKVLSMSEAEREDYISNFVKEHGLKEVFNIVKNAVKSILNTKMSVTAQLYEGFRKKKIVTDEERMAKPTEKEKAQPEDSRLRTVLEKLGDWSVLLTFFLMFAAVGTSDYYNLAVKKPDVSAEMKAFLLTSGAAFMAWTFRYLRSLLNK